MVVDEGAATPLMPLPLLHQHHISHLPVTINSAFAGLTEVASLMRMLVLVSQTPFTSALSAHAFKKAIEAPSASPLRTYFVQMRVGSSTQYRNQSQNLNQNWNLNLMLPFQTRWCMAQTISLARRKTRPTRQPFIRLVVARRISRVLISRVLTVTTHGLT